MHMTRHELGRDRPRKVWRMMYGQWPWKSASMRFVFFLSSKTRHTRTSTISFAPGGVYGTEHTHTRPHTQTQPLHAHTHTHARTHTHIHFTHPSPLPLLHPHTLPYLISHFSSSDYDHEEDCLDSIGLPILHTNKQHSTHHVQHATPQTQSLPS